MSHRPAAAHFRRLIAADVVGVEERTQILLRVRYEVPIRRVDLRDGRAHDPAEVEELDTGCDGPGRERVSAVVHPDPFHGRDGIALVEVVPLEREGFLRSHARAHKEHRERPVHGQQLGGGGLHFGPSGERLPLAILVERHAAVRIRSDGLRFNSSHVTACSSTCRNERNSW
jgi:hypothetical protein